MYKKLKSTTKEIHQEITKQLTNQVNEHLVPILHQMPLRKGLHQFVIKTNAFCPDCKSTSNITIIIDVENITAKKAASDVY